MNIVLGQVSDLTGAPAEGDYALAEALDVLLHPSRVDGALLLTGAAALAILLLLARTRWALLASLVAVVVPTVPVLLTGADGVATVADAGRRSYDSRRPRSRPRRTASVRVEHCSFR